MIKVIYNKVCGRCVQSEPLTSGMVGQPIEFEYSADFDGLTLTAVFTNGKTTVDVLNPGNQCVIPHEVLDTVGTLVKVGVYAVRGNELVIPTVYATIGVVQKGADPSGDVSADPTLPVWAQIQGTIGSLNDLTTEAKNNLVSAINEAAQSSGGSAVELDTTLTQSGKAADAKAVGDALAGKQDKLIAGENITIAADGKTISATGGGGSSIALDTTLTQSGKAADAKAVGDALAGKQDKLIAGENITIAADGKTISATGGGSGGDAVVTAEKAFAASVLELNHVADNQYVAQHDSVLFEATEDTTLSVGNDNMIGAPYSERVVQTLEPAVAYTEIENGYALAYADDFTGVKAFMNQRFGFNANIKSGKTYTLRFYVNAESVGNVYLFLATDKTANGTLIGEGSIRNGTVCQITFTADADYPYVRIAIANLPAEITKITLCEGEVPLEYGTGAESYALLAGEKVWLSGVKGLNCVGVGNFYESPLAITSFNGVAPSTGAVKSCATKKTWVNMGDSLWTFGASTGGIGTITDYMKELCGGTWHNIATGGTTMASRPGSYAGTYDALDFWKIADAIVAGDYTDAKAAAAELTSNFANIDNVNWSAVDYVTVAYGTNDLAFGAAIDNESNPLDTATICGALRYGIKAINSAYPNIRFKVLGVLYRNADSVPITKIIECNNALKNASAYVGAEFVDGYGINAGNSGTFLYDGTHPNANGKVRIAETLARSIHEVWYE